MGNLLCVTGDPEDIDAEPGQANRLAAHRGAPDHEGEGEGGDKVRLKIRVPSLRLLHHNNQIHASVSPHNRQHQITRMSQPVDLKEACREAVLALFPDICPEFLLKTCEEQSHDYEQTITHILDQSEDGKSYPRRPRASRKRKRAEDGEESKESARRFDNEERRHQLKHGTYLTQSKRLIQQAFPQVPIKDIWARLDENGGCLYPAFLAIDKVMEEWDDQNPPFRLLKRPVKLDPSLTQENIDETIRYYSMVDVNENVREALEEFQEARKAQALRRAESDAKLRQEKEESENFDRAVAEGTTATCECCCVDFALNRMVHCNAETLHWFCRDCARRTAETEIGLSRYDLVCMSMDGCQGGFSKDQRDIFLDDNAAIALERIEQEAVLRLAGIENLETCPFCPFAAEYPPVEVNKEFRCQNPDCELVSCRLCREETHIPKTCEEARREHGLSVRRRIEEAMSAALIRTCNKCGTPFIKEMGCNKMTCTRNGCFNVQCYVCSKSCDYTHFNDATRGGRQGNCPLFDNSVEKRHEDEVRAAEESARQQVAQENPDVDDEMLRINISDKVKADDERRKRPPPLYYPPPPPNPQPINVVQQGFMVNPGGEHGMNDHQANNIRPLPVAYRGPGRFPVYPHVPRAPPLPNRGHPPPRGYGYPNLPFDVAPWPAAPPVARAIFSPQEYLNAQRPRHVPPPRPLPMQYGRAVRLPDDPQGAPHLQQNDVAPLDHHPRQAFAVGDEDHDADQSGNEDEVASHGVPSDSGGDDDNDGHESENEDDAASHEVSSEFDGDDDDDAHESENEDDVASHEVLSEFEVDEDDDDPHFEDMPDAKYAVHGLQAWGDEYHVRPGSHPNHPIDLDGLEDPQEDHGSFGSLMNGGPVQRVGHVAPLQH